MCFFSQIFTNFKPDHDIYAIIYTKNLVYITQSPQEVTISQNQNFHPFTKSTFFSTQGSHRGPPTASRGHQVKKIDRIIFHHPSRPTT